MLVACAAEPGIGLGPPFMVKRGLCTPTLLKFASDPLADDGFIRLLLFMFYPKPEWIELIGPLID